MKALYLATVVFAALAVFTAGCEDPAANKPKAQTTDVANGTPANATPNSSAAADQSPGTGSVLADFKAAGKEVEVTPANSKIEFTGSKVTGKHDGGFKEFKGVIDLVDGKAESSRVLVDIKMESVYSDSDGLTDHLKTGDFFEVAKYPNASFKSTKIVADSGKGANAFTVTGELTMRGVTKSVTFPATITVADGGVTVKSEFAINRKDFGIVYAGKADDLIRDDVVLKLDIGSGAKK